MKNNKTSLLRAVSAAFPKTIPILTGFLFLGMSYGIFAKSQGLPSWIPILTSIIVFGGSLEFVGITLLLSPFAPLEAFFVGLMVQARHLFYGISMLDKYRGTKMKKPYLVFGLCDETFSINYSANIPENVDKGIFMLIVTILNHSYWVTGAILGSLAGSFIKFNTEGLDFVMTAMFAVIFLEQLLKEKRHFSSLIGLICSVLCLVIFGAEAFLIPSMLTILLFLTLFRSPIEQKGGLS